MYAQILSINAVSISPNVNEEWLKFAKRSFFLLKMDYKDLTPAELPDEQLGIKENGEAEIFIQIRQTKVSMKVPQGEYSILN